MKSEAELKAVTQFVAEYATRLMGSGVHTSRVVRNTKRLGEALGVRVMVSAFQKVVTFSVYDDESGRVYSEVADIPPLPISFELNSELSALSWDACDLSLPLAEIRRRYDEIVARPRLDPIFTLILVGLANASFCRLFGGEWCAVGIVFTATLLGFYLKQRMQAKGFNHYVIFIASAFAASMYASVAIGIGSLLLGGRIHCPMTVLFIPALLPMIPGMYAYKTVFSMIMFMQNLDDPSAAGYLAAIVRNGFVTFSVIFMLAAGAAAPIFLFNKRAHSLTRNKKQIRS